MFRRLQVRDTSLDDISRVEALVRDRFSVDTKEIVLVSEDIGTRPGFPLLETNVVFWKDGVRHRLKLFAPVAEVSGADLPLAWLLPALVDTGDADCC